MWPSVCPWPPARRQLHCWIFLEPGKCLGGGRLALAPMGRAGPPSPFASASELSNLVLGQLAPVCILTQPCPERLGKNKWALFFFSLLVCEKNLKKRPSGFSEYSGSQMGVILCPKLPRHLAMSTVPTVGGVLLPASSHAQGHCAVSFMQGTPRSRE